MPSSQPAPLSFLSVDELRDQLNFITKDIYSKLDFALQLDGKGIIQPLVLGGLGVNASAWNGLVAIYSGAAGPVSVGTGLNISGGILTATGSAPIAFVTFDCPSGTDPTAIAPLATLTLLSGTTGMTITGNSTTNTITFSLTGTLSTPRIVTATTTELAADDIIICNKTTAMTVNLLAATGSGRLRRIKNINTGLVTVDANGAETIDGETTQPLDQWSCIEIVDMASGVWAIV